ncbi:MAG: amidohydrolase, partial [Planctomycetota bacterium]
GVAHEIKPPRLEGTWEVEIEGQMPHPLVLLFDAEDKLTVRVGETETRGKEVEVLGNRVNLTFESDAHGQPGVWVLSGTLDGDEITGRGRMPGGERFRFRASRTSREGPVPKKDEDEGPVDFPEKYGLPFGPYALDGPPEQPDVVVVLGGTFWTCGPRGVIEDGAMIVKRGRIEWVGPRAEAPEAADAFVIDAAGKHVTPGIVDCHSHTGITGNVNESNQAVTAEVRIQDVTDPDDINWYRQLAGGVTTVLSLHGSANPIGGQSQTVKLRWGVAHPDEMHFEGAAAGIKFALGENVKQSNWGDEHTTRYPQTRMGVETLIRDRFTAAREYAGSWRKWEYLGAKGAPPRRDLELEALAEVLAGSRLLHCHSYRQDEILMLCRVAKDFGFRIGTFQHVLEGYKVAEAIREHALGASCFSDWWAYKVEVQDAIPENGAIMHEVGVCVSFNSDSSELARRLNVEAAKGVKYGRMTPEDALKLVTLFPARQMKIDQFVGSLEPGKHADFAVWSKDPLSTTAVCERTWIDGREYFSLEKDEAHRRRIEGERERLIQKALAAKEKKKWWEEEEEEDYEGGGR